MGENDDGVDDVTYFTLWISAAFKRKIQHLNVHCQPRFHKNPLRLYNCETLAYLKLFEVTLDDARFVSFPCMKTMHLKDIAYPNEATSEILVSSCPVLEDLTIIIHGIDAKVFRVHSRSLKRLSLVRLYSFKRDTFSGVVIDAPLLCCLSIKDNVSKSYIVNNLDSNAKLNISFLFGLLDYAEASISSRRSSIHNFLQGISRIKEMIACPRTFMLIYQYSKLEPLPSFGCMSSLVGEFR